MHTVASFPDALGTCGGVLGVPWCAVLAKTSTAPWGQHELGYGLLADFVGPGHWLVTFWRSSSRFWGCGLVFLGVPWLFHGVPWPGPLFRGAVAVPCVEQMQANQGRIHQPSYRLLVAGRAGFAQDLREEGR